MTTRARRLGEAAWRAVGWPLTLFSDKDEAREAAFQRHFLRQGRSRRTFGIVMLGVLGLTTPWYAPALFDVPAQAFGAVPWPLWWVMTGLVVAALVINYVTNVRLRLIVTISAMNYSALVYFTVLRVTASDFGFDVPTTIPASVLVGFAVLAGVPARANLVFFCAAALGGVVSEIWWIAPQPELRMEVYGMVVLCVVGLAGALAVEHAARSAWNDRAALAYRANYDDLTGLLSRVYFREQFDTLARAAERDGQALSLALVDLDHFKQINDTHGHPVGDEVIRCVGEEIRLACRRGTDLGARLGGEEYALLLYGAGPDAAVAIAERLMQRIRDLTFHDQAGRPLNLQATSSMGLMVVQPGGDYRRTVILAAADRLLYRAKGAGRDRLCWETSTGEPDTKLPV